MYDGQTNIEKRTRAKQPSKSSSEDVEMYSPNVEDNEIKQKI